jgi:glycosyltransferase involved in cell wall biosynthesis
VSALRVGIDYLPAVSHVPGMGRYARELVRALVRLDDRPDLGLYEVGRAERSVDEEALGILPGSPRIHRMRSSTPRRLLRWSPLRSARSADAALGGVDLFHHTSRVLPPIADALETLAVSEIPPPGSPEERFLARALARADGALVFSENTAKRLGSRFGFDPAHVHQVGVGCEHARRVLGEPPPRESIPRILAIGPLRKDRRPLRLIRAFELLSEDGLMAHLHFVGGAGDDQKDFERVVATSKARLRIVRQRSLAEKDLAALLARSSVLVHLVEEAGTPVTPLEAFSLGTPVVASRLPAYEEALDGQAELVQNSEIDHASDVLADALERAIRSAADPVACAARARLAANFTWERNARETVAAWRVILGRASVRSSRP